MHKLLDAGRFVLVVPMALAVAVGCSHEISGPKSTADKVAPQAVCNDQLVTEVSLSGAGFSPLPTRTLPGGSVAEQTVLPQISLTRTKDLSGVAGSGTVIVPDDPLNTAESDVTWTDQSHMTFFVCPQGVCSTAFPKRTDYVLPEGLYSIEVKNRNDSPPASYPDVLTVVPPPVLDEVNPELVCKDQTCTVTLTGKMFVKIANRVGYVTVGEDPVARDFDPVLSDCRPLPAAAGLDLQACTTATITIPAKWLPVGQHRVVLTNPDPLGCHSTEPVILTFVPEPTVLTVEPDLECVEEGDQPMRITGADFLSIDGRLPMVLVDAALSFPATGVDGCVPVAGPVRTVAQTCASLSFVLPKNSVPPGRYAVKVKNPAPADCTSSTSAPLEVLPSPVLASIQPDLACNAQGTVALALAGTGFVTVDGVTPHVILVPTAPGGIPVDIAATSATGCTDIVGLKEAVQTCTGLLVVVPQSLLPPGLYAVAVTNPETAACSSKEARTLLIVPPPTLVSLDPPERCNAQGPIDITLTGSDFYVVDAVLPTVRFTQGVSVVSLVPKATTGCTPVAGVAQSVQRCTGLVVTVAAAQLPVGSWDVTVENPAPVACISTGKVTFNSTAPPILSSVAPQKICRGGGALSLTGERFAVGMTTTAGALVASQTTVAAGGGSATALLGPGLSPSTTPYPVTVMNPDGCFAVWATPGLLVETGPIIYFTDPPVVYNGITTVVTVYGSAELRTDKPVQTVTMTLTGTSSTPIPLAIVADPTDLTHSHVQVSVPKDTPPGVYDLTLTTSGPCPAVLPAAIKVTNSLTLTIASMTPSFGGTTQNVPATVKGTGFVATPRGYLSPTSGSAAATALRATAFLDGSTLTTSVRSGLPVGSYNLIVVNADGGVGVLQNAFNVTTNPPPEITDISPGSVPTSGAPPVVIDGRYFAADAAVALRCVDPNGASLGMVNAAVTSNSPTKLTFTVPALPTGTRACVIRVTNAAEAIYGEYSSLTVTNPAQNLGGLRAGSLLKTPRRALAAVAGRANSAARYLYAIGGDDGNVANALGTVEVASVDLFGTLGAWTTLPYQLPTPLTHVSAVSLGNHIYVVGGHDGSKATKVVLRAVVQDPLNVPQIDDVDLTAGNGAGLGGGTWYYRVSAIMAAGDVQNPDGETLASDPFVLSLPDFTDKLQVKLMWQPFPGAASYRVYRNPTAAQGSGSEQLIATVPAPASGQITYTDTGAVPTGATPLPIGTTTKWVPIAPLNAARAGAGVARLISPVDANVAYLYALGGLDDTGAALGSYEVCTITLGATGQTVSSWTSGAALPAGSERWQLSAYAAEPTTSSYVAAGTAFIYAGAGLAGSGGSVVDQTQAFPVTLPGGTLGAAVSVKSMSVAGYGSMIANNTLYVFGGGPTPTGTASSGQICMTGSPGPCSVGPPALDNNSWNSLGGISLTPRYLMGSTLESSFVYLVGGTGGGGPLNTTLLTLW